MAYNPDVAKRYYLKKRNKILKTCALYRKNNPEKRKKYREENKEKIKNN